MFKSMMLAVALVGLFSVSGPAQAVREGGCVKDGDCPLIGVSKLQGKLVKVVDHRRMPDPGPGKGRSHMVRLVVNWQLQTKDKTYTLDLNGTSGLMWKQGYELVGQQVIVTGVVKGDRIQVRDVQADDTREFTGKLVTFRRPLLPNPGDGKYKYRRGGWRNVWQLVVDQGPGTRSHSYELGFPTLELKQKAETLVNKNIKVTGKLTRSGFVLQVTALDLATPSREVRPLAIRAELPARK